MSFQQSLALKNKSGASAADGASLRVLPIAWEAVWPLWWPRVARVSVLLLADGSAFLLAVALGYVLWALPVRNQSLTVYEDLLPVFLLFPLGYAGAGLYPGFGLGAPETLRRLFSCTSLAFLVLAAASFAMKLPAHFSRMTFVLAWGAGLFTVPLFRLLTLSLVRRRRWWGEPVVLVGNGQWIQSTIRALEQTLSLGYRPVGILSSDFLSHNRTVEGVPVLGSLEGAPLLVEHGVHTALVGEEESSQGNLSRLQRHFRHVMVIRGYEGLPVAQVHVRNLGGVLGVEFTNNLLRWQNRLIKRMLDIVLGSVMLFAAIPLILLGGLVVKRLSAGPVFFSQERKGVGGRPFTVWKLRTMYPDAEQRLEECLSMNPQLRQEWEAGCKLTHDPRTIPGVGEVLRRWSVDELPQLWNVVKGEMSLVGPRPFPEYHLERFPAEFRKVRQQVRPGLTGMWQVSVRSNGGIEQQQLYDTEYIRNWSIWLDIHILVRTVFAVLSGRGAC